MKARKNDLKIGVMLVNLGSPSAPDTASVRRYLRQFLSDPRVVEIPKFAWFFILNGIVLFVRPRKSAAAYRKIWLPEGSPLVVHSQNQAARLQAALGDAIENNIMVCPAMRYDQPSIESVMREFREKLC